MDLFSEHVMNSIGRQVDQTFNSRSVLPIHVFVVIYLYIIVVLAASDDA